MTLYPVTDSFAAEVGDIDLSKPLSDTEHAEIEAAFNRYSVLVFSDQELSPDQHLDFARRFGSLETTIHVFRKDAKLRLRPEFGDISNLVPVLLAAKMRRSHFLFMGYSLRDWNLRVILHRIWGEQKLSYKSWAIQLNPQELDLRFWLKRDVDILNTRLEDYVAALNKYVQEMPQSGGAL